MLYGLASGLFTLAINPTQSWRSRTWEVNPKALARARWTFKKEVCRKQNSGTCSMLEAYRYLLKDLGEAPSVGEELQLVIAPRRGLIQQRQQLPRRRRHLRCEDSATSGSRASKDLEPPAVKSSSPNACPAHLRWEDCALLGSWLSYLLTMLQ